MAADLRGGGSGSRRERGTGRKVRATALTAFAAGSFIALGASPAAASPAEPAAPVASAACQPNPAPKPETQSFWCGVSNWVWEYLYSFPNTPAPGSCYQFHGRIYNGPCGAPMTDLGEKTVCE